MSRPQCPECGKKVDDVGNILCQCGMVPSFVKEVNKWIVEEVRQEYEQTQSPLLKEALDDYQWADEFWVQAQVLQKEVAQLERQEADTSRPLADRFEDSRKIRTLLTQVQAEVLPRMATKILRLQKDLSKCVRWISEEVRLRKKRAQEDGRRNQEENTEEP